MIRILKSVFNACPNNSNATTCLRNSMVAYRTRKSRRMQIRCSRPAKSAKRRRRHPISVREISLSLIPLLLYITGMKLYRRRVTTNSHQVYYRVFVEVRVNSAFNLHGEVHRVEHVRARLSFLAHRHSALLRLPIVLQGAAAECAGMCSTPAPQQHPGRSTTHVTVESTPA